LQFAATKLWEGRDARHKVLTRASYEQMGGLAGALSTHADDVVAGLSPAARRLARAVLLRLVTPEGTRAIVDASELHELSETDEVVALLDQLAQARLLVMQKRGESEGATVELVHESLIQSWPTLRRWLDESQEDAAFLSQLRSAARQWQSRGRPEGLLWRGETMEEARQFQRRYRGALATRERAFLDAVLALASRWNRRKRMALIATFTVLVAGIAAAAVALVMIRSAERDAVEHADRATVEAERARAAERQVKSQLAVIKSEKRDKEKFRAEADEKGAEVAKSREQLRAKNVELEGALEKAEAEHGRAREAAMKAERAASDVRKANASLKKLLEQERARAERLERQRKKIKTELR